MAQKMINGLPVFEAVLDDYNIGIFTVSLVDDPATSVKWIAFAKDAKASNPLKFSIVDEKEHKVLSVIMRADFPIYRVDEQGNGFYITFSKETLYEASKRLLLNGFQNYVNVEHIASSNLYGFQLAQIYQKDVARGINPAGFEDIEDGSLFGEYFVSDETLWEEILAGKFTGISLEGEFGIDKVEEGEQEINTLDELVEALGL